MSFEIINFALHHSYSLGGGAMAQPVNNNDFRSQWFGKPLTILVIILTLLLAGFQFRFKEIFWFIIINYLNDWIFNGLV